MSHGNYGIKSEAEDSLEQAMSVFASAIADPSRASILCALMDGRAWTATELSIVAGIAPSTASGHLTRLLNNGLVVCLMQGRHRYYSLAGAHIAGLLENLMGVSVQTRHTAVTRTPVPLRYARTCYDHLAGELAVKIYDALLRENWIVADGSALTAAGNAHFTKMGVVMDPRSRRKPCCACLDWSERRFHLGGSAGSGLLSLFDAKGWIQRTAGYREVRVTESGSSALSRWFNLK
ncbi:winged helix-turn-helix domain-containing protein [Tatumella terrea]|uniref:ArsR/SmtB family transcription factor n=1 Tax=Tatumella terrea TaxID=419007 RepID=UPI0031DD2701